MLKDKCLKNISTLIASRSEEMAGSSLRFLYANATRKQVRPDEVAFEVPSNLQERAKSHRSETL